MKIQIGFMSAKRILELSKGEIKLPELYNHRFNPPKPEVNGLLCEKIYGPIDSFKCRCGQLSGSKNKNLTCPTCGVVITHSDVRSKWMGHIELPILVLNPLAIKAVGDILSCGENPLRKSLSNGEHVLNFIESNKGNFILKDGRQGDFVFSEAQVITEDIENNPDDFFFIPEALSLVDYEASKSVNGAISYYMNFGTNPEDFLLRRILVPPATYRPVIFNREFWISHYLNDHYSRIVRRRNRAQRLTNLAFPKRLLILEQHLLQKAVTELFIDGGRDKKNKPLPSIMSSISSKSGLIRGSLLGKRVDYSGRSVISVDPFLKISEVGIPIKMAKELFKPHLIHKFVSHSIAPSIKIAKEIIEEGTDPLIYKFLYEVATNHRVFINRQPSLHRYSIQAFKMQLIPGKCIMMPNMNMAPFNADCDGDTVAVFLPISQEGINDAEKFDPKNNLISSADGKPLIKPAHEMIIGAAYMTRIQKKEKPRVFCNFDEAYYVYQLDELPINEEIFIRKKRTCLGREILTTLLEQEIDYVLNKKNITNLVSSYYDCHSNKQIEEMLLEFQQITLEQATKSGLSVSMSDLFEPSNKIEVFNKARKKVKDLESKENNSSNNEEKMRIWAQAIDDVQKCMIKEYGSENPFVIMYETGARASLIQISQITVAKGLISKFGGQILPKPIESSLRKGLNPMEYMDTCYGSRKSMADKYFLTPKSGYLARRMINAARDLYVDNEDCGSTTGILIKRVNASGRFTVDNILLGDSKEPGYIEVRSPITCCSKTRGGVCKKCFGINLATRDLIEDNCPVGIIATQSLTEPATQLTMRTFHTGGAAEIKSHPRVILSSIQGTVTITEILPDQLLTWITVSNKEETRKYLVHNRFADILVGDTQIIVEQTPLAVYRKNISSDDISGKLPKLEHYFEARYGKGNPCVVSVGSGVIKLVPNKDSIEILVNGKFQGKSVDAPIFFGEGDITESGERLSYGEVRMKEYFDRSDLVTSGKVFSNRVKELYDEEGIFVNSIHIETIFRAMTEIVLIKKTNQLELRRKVNDSEEHKVLFNGITKVSKDYPSWLKVLGFGWTKQNLVHHSLKRSISYDLPSERIMTGELWSDNKCSEGWNDECFQLG